MHYVYIIYSPKFDKFYVGETEDIITRLKQHNEHAFHGASTAYANDWKLKKSISLQNRKEARTVEKYIKAMKSKKFIEAIISNEEAYEKFRHALSKKFEIHTT